MNIVSGRTCDDMIYIINNLIGNISGFLIFFSYYNFTMFFIEIFTYANLSLFYSGLVKVNEHI
jgi:hypothetical protein